MNDPDFYILCGECRHSMMDQLNSELNIAKVLKDMTYHFDLKLFHLILKNGQIKQRVVQGRY